MATILTSIKNAVSQIEQVEINLGYINTMSRDKESVRKALTALVSANSDSTIIDYLVGILEDEQFEFGEDASVAYDALGDFLVR